MQFGRIIDRLNRFLQPSRNRQVRVSVVATISLGCADCPFRKSVVVPVIGTMTLSGVGGMPVSFALTMEQRSSLFVATTKLPTVGTGGCKNAGKDCEWHSKIDAMFALVSAHPVVLDLKPHVQVVTAEPMQRGDEA